ncbi:MAG: hypothetical protein V1710_07915 [Candidatus Bathyarchaeota archaeon]
MTLYVEDYKYVKEALLTRYGFTEEHAEDAIQRLSESPQIFNDFVAYLRTNRNSGLSVQGHNVDGLMVNYGLSPIGAYLMLSELAVNPQMAKGYLDEMKNELREEAEYNPDGSIKKITFSTHSGGVSSGAPVCPKCGKQATWIEQYQRWYCYDCKEYI